MSDPNENGVITGGSENANKNFKTLIPVTSFPNFPSVTFPLPLTFNCAENVAFPASFLAMQVYFPEWAYPTASIERNDARAPTGAVEMPVLEDEEVASSSL